MQGNCHGYGYTQSRILQSSQESGQPLRKIVNTYGKSCEKAHPKELATVSIIRICIEGDLLFHTVIHICIPLQYHRFIVKGSRDPFGADLMRVFSLGNEIVYQTNKNNSSKERSHVDPVGPVFPIGQGKGFLPLQEYLNKGNIKHYPCGKTR